MPVSRGLALACSAPLSEEAIARRIGEFLAQGLAGASGSILVSFWIGRHSTLNWFMSWARLRPVQKAMAHYQAERLALNQASHPVVQACLWQQQCKCNWAQAVRMGEASDGHGGGVRLPIAAARLGVPGDA